ncbi:MAG: hypothetical protein A2Y04_05515 [Omnitrophica WOR_2 bacterium GWC2_45_7]|nr:MAG: hypothetical protein A2Y04_05515 [Omnitrophica WOR_2 bacterium GWC2_45_7]
MMHLAWVRHNSLAGGKAGVGTEESMHDGWFNSNLLTYEQLMEPYSSENVGRDTDCRNVPLFLGKSVVKPWFD